MKNKSGLSLVELIVATMVSTIVIFGLFSMMNSVQNSSSNIGKNSYVEASVRATVNDIIRSAQVAVGTKSSPGFIRVNGNTICLSYQGTTAANDRDGWNCYTVVGSHDIYKCQKQGVSETAAACVSTDPGYSFLGTTSVPNPFSSDNNGGLPNAGQVDNYNTNIDKNIFTITITSRVNPGADPSVTNKEYSYTESVLMTGQTLD